LTELPNLIKSAKLELEREQECSRYLQSLSNRIEDRTVALLIPDSQKNTFRLYLSGIYAIIVSLLIAGFFTVAFVDGRVRASIFSVQAGIQFITLFSLVIAIILFGILGILQDKELAALLGGISGYILGRATTERATVSAAPATFRSITAATIAFNNPNIITDSGNRLGIFQVGDRVQVIGSTQNNGSFTLATVSAGSIQTREQTVQTEGAGAMITITAL
jgi:hypothetical protein